jgi:hypothetical protein
MTTAAPEIDLTASKAKPRTLHVRCCLPAVPHGLCGAGERLNRQPRLMPRQPNECVVCTEMWEGGHDEVCPMDSPGWNQ